MPIRRSAAQAVAAYFGIAMFFLAVSFLWGKTKSLGDGVFWDGLVYAKAIAVYHAGGNPYLAGPLSLPFVSPPIFLKAAAWLGNVLPGHSGWLVYLAVVVLSTLSIPYLLAKFYLRSEWLSPQLALLLYAVQPRFIVEQSLNCGNIASTLYALILVAGIGGIQRNRWLWFYITVILAALVKPAYLTFLLLPLLAGKRQLWLSGASVGTVFVAYGLQRVSMPELYEHFQQAIYRQLFVKHDIGIGIYSAFYRLVEKVTPSRADLAATSAYCALAGLVLAGLFLVRKQSTLHFASRFWVPGLLVAAVLVNPRMQDYDTAIAIVPALYIWVEGLRFACKQSSGLPYVAIATALFLFIFTTDYPMGVCFLLLVSVGTAVLIIGRSPQKSFGGT